MGFRVSRRVSVEGTLKFDRVPSGPYKRVQEPWLSTGVHKALYQAPRRIFMKVLQRIRSKFINVFLPGSRASGF